MKPWRWLAALRVFLELVGIGFLASLAFFRVFPGGWRGLGIGYAYWIASRNPGDQAAPPPLSSADLAAILLAVATIVLAVVAFFISVGAFLGYNEIKEIASRVATEKLQASLSEFERRFGELQANVNEERAQAKGLSGDLDADAFARAASGIDPEIPL